MSKQPATEMPVDNKKNGNGHAAPTGAVADTSVDTENPNDAIEAYHQRLREQIDKP